MSPTEASDVSMVDAVLLCDIILPPNREVMRTSEVRSAMVDLGKWRLGRERARFHGVENLCWLVNNGDGGEKEREIVIYCNHLCL